jgi:hypothetical protein
MKAGQRSDTELRIVAVSSHAYTLNSESVLYVMYPPARCTVYPSLAKILPVKS